MTTLRVPLRAILHEGFQDSGLDYRSVMDVMPSYLGGRDEESLIYSQPTPHESMDGSWRGVVAILFEWCHMMSSIAWIGQFCRPLP